MPSYISSAVYNIEQWIQVMPSNVSSAGYNTEQWIQVVSALLSSAVYNIEQWIQVVSAHVSSAGYKRKQWIWVMPLFHYETVLTERTPILPVIRSDSEGIFTSSTYSQELEN